MKHLFLAILSAVAVSACGGGGSGVPAQQPVAPTVQAAASTPYYNYSTFTLCQTSACSSDLVSQFHVDNWFWSASTIYDESVMPLTGKTNYGLWRPATAVKTVRNRQTGQVYSPGSDYQYVNGQFIIPPGSTIATTDPTWITTTVPGTPAQYSPETVQGTGLHVGDDWQQHQIAVTYTSTTYTPPPPDVTSFPANFIAKLKSGQPVAIDVEGDSITYGADSTGQLGMAPNQPGYIGLVVAYLSQLYPGQVYVRNHAVPGWTSAQVLANAPANMADVASDLTIVAVGMNDMPAGVTGAQFQQNLQGIIAAARWVNPNTEVVLVSSWPSNPDWVLTQNQAFIDYNGAMYALAGSINGVSVANVTSVVWAGMSNQKSFYDITGNGVNHPNDFMYVAYAQTVLKTILNLP